MKKYNRTGFTLVELLLVIAILAVMATMSLAVMRGATEDAKATATQSRISKIESLMRLQLEQYEVRRLPISNQELLAYVKANPISVVPPFPPLVQLRNLRRRIIADLIVAEMPRPLYNSMTNIFSNNSDLGVFPTRNAALDSPTPYNVGFARWLDTKYPNPFTVGGLRLRARLENLQSAGVNTWAPFNGLTDFNLPAEYMYELIKRVDFDGSSGIEGLGNAAIGDSDGDGYLEVVDAWGGPLHLRILQVIGSETPAGSNTDLWENAATNWTLKETSVGPLLGLPVGFSGINPVIPRELDQIRVQVVSPRLDSY